MNLVKNSQKDLSWGLTVYENETGEPVETASHMIGALMSIWEDVFKIGEK